MELLRFSTAGSVDDGKSTLIGRLLYDSKSIFEDQYESIEASSRQRGEDQVNLALLTDGLKAEREQGITIDVAYRYFHTPKRKFIIADTPGHVQYTRNMVTGASTANLALVLVDARKGISEQTSRHAYIASLLRIPHLVFCVNKMDLVDYDEGRFNEIQAELEAFAAKLEVKDIHYIPISALKGDNVVDRSESMPWYQGGTLLHLLENVHIASDIDHEHLRLPIQYVIRPQRDEFHDFRGYAGRLAAGVVKKGDEVQIQSNGMKTRVKAVYDPEREIDVAYAPMSVTVTLEDDIDLSRGDMLTGPGTQPEARQQIDLMLCWLGERPLNPAGRYILRHTSAEALCKIQKVNFKVDINTLDSIEDDNAVGMNDIAQISLKVNQPLYCDPYARNRKTGSVILVEEGTNSTVAAGMIG